MIEITKQTNLDVNFFISQDEPFYKILSLYIGMLKKDYLLVNNSPFIRSSNSNGDTINFTKFDSNKHSRNHQQPVKRTITVIDNNNDINITQKIVITKPHRWQSAALQVSYEMTSQNSNSSNLIQKYSSDLNISKLNLKMPKIKYQIELPMDQIIEDSTAKNVALKPSGTSSPQPITEIDDNNLNINLGRIKFFEENWKRISPVFLMVNFCHNPAPIQITQDIKDFAKLNKYINTIEETSIPTNEAKRKFLDLCSLFKKNTVVNMIKISNLTFNKNDYTNSLKIKLTNLDIAHEKSFDVYNYIDHPGLNFLSDFLDRTRLFDIVEAKISKEIITRI